jgi:hypothetical protein
MVTSSTQEMTSSITIYNPHEGAERASSQTSQRGYRGNNGQTVYEVKASKKIKIFEGLQK